MPYITGDKAFELALPYTLKEEGGKSNDKHDPGGRTNFGIVQREYDKWRRGKGLPPQSVFAISEDEYREIYYTEYWMPHCASCPAGLSLSVFDNNVNEGTFRSTVMLQRALGITGDGVWGPDTRRVVSGLVDPSDIGATIVRFAQQRAQFYHGLSTFKYFGADWIERTTRIRDASLKLSKASATADQGPMT